MSARPAPTLETLRRVLDELVGPPPRTSLAEVAHVLRRHGMQDVAVERVVVVLDTAERLAARPVDGTRPSAGLTPRQLEELLAGVT